MENLFPKLGNILKIFTSVCSAVTDYSGDTGPWPWGGWPLGIHPWMSCNFPWCRKYTLDTLDVLQVYMVKEIYITVCAASINDVGNLHRRMGFKYPWCGKYTPLYVLLVYIWCSKHTPLDVLQVSMVLEIYTTGFLQVYMVMKNTPINVLQVYIV